MSEWTTELPSEPGWYAVEYTGVRSKKRKCTVWKLAYPETGILSKVAKCVLAIEDCTPMYGESFWRELDFREDCQPVLWSQRLDVPKPSGTVVEIRGEE
jgi:hypothetical protein